MKRELTFYKSYYAPLSMQNIVPKFEFSKNVQAWWFTRNYTLTWIRWALTYTITIQSDLEEERTMAHESNVKKYMSVK